MVQMPKYRCHKEVWALKIRSVEERRPTIEELDRILEGRLPDFGGFITPEDSRYGTFGVPIEYMRKHEPKAGGYFVVYNDGYKSYSPAQAFEEGYTLIGDAEAQKI